VRALVGPALPVVPWVLAFRMLLALTLREFARRKRARVVAVG